MDAQPLETPDLGHRQWEDQTDLPVGEILKRTRGYYNLAIKDVAQHLRLRPHQLSALEEGKHEQLPGRAYVIGFIRAYAEYLGLNGEKMVHLYKAQFGSQRNAQPAAKRRKSHAPESKAPNIYILGVSFLALAGMLVAYIVWGDHMGRAGLAIPDAPSFEQKGVSLKTMAALPLEAALANAVRNSVGTEGPEALVKPQAHMVINAIDSAWVEIRNAQNKALLSRIMKAGDIYIVPDEPGLVLDTGNAGALELVVDGVVMAPLGAKGDVMRKISLDAASVIPKTETAPVEEAVVE